MNFDCIWTNFWNKINEKINETFFNVFDINFDKNIEKRKNFDEIIDREIIFVQNIDFFDVFFLLVNFIFSTTIVFFRTMIAKMFIFSNLNLLFSKT